MITIVTDTTSSIPIEIAERLGIPMLPQIIIFGDQSYRDDYEISSEEFLNHLRGSTTLPKTAAPPPALYYPIYEKYAHGSDTVIVLTPSSDVSGTYRSAQVAAGDYPEADIRVVDTRTVGSGLGSIVFQAHQWVEQGLDANSIVERIKSLSARQVVYFVVDTLEYLHKGGRIGGAKMFVGSILQVKPILQLIDGHIEPAESQRTKTRAMARLKELVYTSCPRGTQAQLTIMQADVEAEANALALEMGSHLGLSKVEVFKLPPAIMVHAGPGVIAVSFFVDSQEE
jgi:DegV family protein with EDD domain